MTPLFGPGWGNYAIRGIVETSLPDAVSMQPQTAGWGALALLLIAWVGHRSLGIWRDYQRNQYRRDALAELAVLKPRVLAGDTQALRELAPLLRATALGADTRSPLRELSGEAWAGAVQGLAPTLPTLPVETLMQLAYAPLPLSQKVDYKALIEQFEQWIRLHELSDA